MALVSKQAPWDGSQIPSQQGKVAIVTGANSGIGFETAKRLVERGVTVVLACQSEVRGLEAEALITQHLQQYKQHEAHGDNDDGQNDDDVSVGSVEFMQVDMGELASIFRFSRRFRDRFEKLDLLLNNAGVSIPSQKRTMDGFESQFGVNHIGAFYLTRLLFGVLKKAPAARVVAVSSIAHWSARLDFETLATGENASSWADFTGYANSKMANSLFTYELDRRLNKKGIRSIKAVAVHPGLTHTAIFAKYIIDWILPRFLQWLLLKILFMLPFNTVEMGSLPILYAATVESVQSGEYYGPDSFGERRGYPTREISTPASYSESDAEKLWTLSEEIVEERFDVQRAMRREEEESHIFEETMLMYPCSLPWFI